MQEQTQSLAFSLGRDSSGNRISDPQGISYALVRQALTSRRPVIRQSARPTAVDLSAGPALPSSATPGARDTSADRSIMTAPLLAREQLLGVVYLESDPTRRGFRNDDLAILIGLASHLAISIVSSRALQLEVEATISKRRIDEQRPMAHLNGKQSQL